MMLIECLTYMAMFVIVLGLSTRAFFRCWDAYDGYRSNTETISSALKAGELWRADIRAARGAIRSTEYAGGQTLQVPTAAGEIVYTFVGAEVRRASANGPDRVLLRHVKRSIMRRDATEGGVLAWRWELELDRSGQTTVSNRRPLFSFAAVNMEEQRHDH